MQKDYYEKRNAFKRESFWRMKEGYFKRIWELWKSVIKKLSSRYNCAYCYVVFVFNKEEMCIL